MVKVLLIGSSSLGFVVLARTKLRIEILSLVNKMKSDFVRRTKRKLVAELE